ncbi:hypothetical protein C8R44DRAFT_877180 [Mycena epipterygia]|nr:hypothetical protein C8R44DRAFT_877180 [Mycena epipterygia]
MSKSTKEPALPEAKFLSNSPLAPHEKVPRGLRNTQVYSQLLGENYVLYPKTKAIIGSLLESHLYHVLVAENTSLETLCSILELSEDEWQKLSAWVGGWFIHQDFEDAKREVFRVMLLGEARREFPWIQQYENGWPLEIAWDRTKARYSQMCRQLDSSPLKTNIPRVQ